MPLSPSARLIIIIVSLTSAATLLLLIVSPVPHPRDDLRTEVVIPAVQLQSAADKGTDEVSLCIHAADTAIEQGDTIEAFAQLNRARSIEDSSRVKWKLIHLFNVAGNYAAALEQLTALETVEPTEALYRAKARDQYLLGTFEDSKVSLLKALDRNPIDAELLRQLSQVERKLGNDNKALGCARKAVGVSPSDARSRLWLGLLYVSTRQFDEAEQELKQCVSLKGDLLALYWLGMIWKHRGDGRWEGCVKDLKDFRRADLADKLEIARYPEMTVLDADTNRVLNK